MAMVFLGLDSLQMDAARHPNGSSPCNLCKIGDMAETEETLENGCDM